MRFLGSEFLDAFSSKPDVWFALSPDISGRFGFYFTKNDAGLRVAFMVCLPTSTSFESDSLRRLFTLFETATLYVLVEFWRSFFEWLNMIGV